MNFARTLKGAKVVDDYIKSSGATLMGCMDDKHPMYVYAYPVLFASIVMHYVIDNANDDKGYEMAENAMQVARRVTLDFEEKYQKWKRGN